MPIWCINWLLIYVSHCICLAFKSIGKIYICNQNLFPQLFHYHVYQEECDLMLYIHIKQGEQVLVQRFCFQCYHLYSSSTKTISLFYHEFINQVVCPPKRLAIHSESASYYTDSFYLNSHEPESASRSSLYHLCCCGACGTSHQEEALGKALQ